MQGKTRLEFRLFWQNIGIRILSAKKLILIPTLSLTFVAYWKILVDPIRCFLVQSYGLFFVFEQLFRKYLQSSQKMEIHPKRVVKGFFHPLTTDDVPNITKRAHSARGNFRGTVFKFSPDFINFFIPKDSECTLSSNLLKIRFSNNKGIIHVY